MLLALRCGRLLVQLQLPALLLCFARSSEQHCATSPRGGHCWAAALHVQSMSVWVRAHIPAVPGLLQRLFLTAQGFTCVPTARTSLHSAAVIHRCLCRLWAARALAAPCAMPGQQPAVPLGARSPSSGGAGDANEFAYIELQARL